MLLTTVSLIKIYQCLCDPTRLRILSLLGSGELCVCHFQEILGEPQVKISKHLAYLRAHGLVESRKEANWVVYRLPSRRSRELSANLACLQDCVSENPVFTRDSARRRNLESRMGEAGPLCCSPRQFQAGSLPARQ
jgi:ArsR family transcriptional regulator, arsenate/arsenite/antimonite-responsive transcriptional repressor